MEGWLVALLVLGAVVLGILNVVETIEYRRYRKAAHAVIALANSMQESFNQVTSYLNRNNAQLNTLGQSQLIAEQDINFIKAVMFIHSQALNLNMGKNFKLNDEFVNKIKADWDQQVSEADGEDPITEV